MARIRTIKPDFFANDGLADMGHAHRLLFIGLWTLADREGRLEDRPQRIWAQIFPYEKGVDVDDLLDDLAAGGFVVRYEVDGERLIELPSFAKHQRPHPKEPPSTLPPRPGGAPLRAVRRWVYFVQARGGGPIKIGSASNVAARVDSLQTSHHEELAVLGVLPCSVSTEREIHARFAAARLRGEWFSPTKDLLAFVQSLKAADEQPCIPDEQPCIPSSPVGREGKGREGDLGREGNGPAASPPVPLPRLPDDKFSSGAAFFAWVQNERYLAGFPVEKPPRNLSAWFSEAMMALNGNGELLEGTLRAFVFDPYWRERNCPFQAFVSQWQKYVPRRAVAQ